MKKIVITLVLITILMSMGSLASDRISENEKLKSELYLKSFDFEPKNIKMGSSDPINVNFIATIYAKNGIVENNSTGFVTQATFLGPYSLSTRYLSKEEMNVDFQMSNKILGDKVNGTYKQTLNLLKGTKEGIWRLESIKLVDTKGNIRTLKGDDLKSLPTELYVEVGLGRWFLILGILPLIFFGILFAGYKLTSKKMSIPMIWKGHDGRTSSSKFQFSLWICVALYAYIVIMADAYLNHRISPIGLLVPQNLILAMGLSATTTLAAKGITSSYAKDEKVDKSETGKGGLFFDDDGYPDLSQIQLISWTLIGVGIFLLKTFSDVMGSSGATTGLPDIDKTLLILMGIGEGAYIGKKIVTTDDPGAPKLSNINPKKGTVETMIYLTGNNFGEKEAGFITIGDKKVEFKDDSHPEWTSQKVGFQLKGIDTAKDNDLKNSLIKGKVVRIGIISGKKSSAETQEFTIE